MLDPDMSTQEMQLIAGEMTPQEIRTARAFIRLANSKYDSDGGLGVKKVVKFNHAYTVAFEVSGSKSFYGEDVDKNMMREALVKRIQSLMENDEMLEAVGAPFDTYQEG